MATQAKLTIRVTSQRAGSTINFSTAGRYISLPVNGITDTLTKQPVLTTASAQAFWLQVLPLVQAAIEAES